MLRRHAPIAVLLFLALGSACGPARPAAAAVVSGWAVSEKPDKDGVCTGVYSYENPSDKKKINVLAFMSGRPDPTSLLIGLLYDGFNFTEETAFAADLLADGKVVVAAAQWHAKGKLVYTETADVEALASQIKRTKAMAIRIGQEDIGFQTPNIGPTLIALGICLNQ